MDAHPEAIGGFGDRVKEHALKVRFSDDLLMRLPGEKRDGAIAFLTQDPRPAVHRDPGRVYKIAYAGYDIHFTVQEDQLLVVDVVLVVLPDGFLLLIWLMVQVRRMN